MHHQDACQFDLPAPHMGVFGQCPMACPAIAGQAMGWSWIGRASAQDCDEREKRAVLRYWVEAGTSFWAGSETATRGSGPRQLSSQRSSLSFFHCALVLPQFQGPLPVGYGQARAQDIAFQGLAIPSVHPDGFPRAPSQGPGCPQGWHKACLFYWPSPDNARAGLG